MLTDKQVEEMTDSTPTWAQAAHDARALIDELKAKREALKVELEYIHAKLVRLGRSERFFLEMDAKGEPWPTSRATKEEL